MESFDEFRGGYDEIVVVDPVVICRAVPFESDVVLQLLSVDVGVQDLLDFVFFFSFDDFGGAVVLGLDQGWCLLARVLKGKHGIRGGSSWSWVALICRLSCLFSR